MKKPSSAILCIARNEQPFTAEWIEYHIRLGFDKIYFVSTDDCYEHIVRYFDGIELSSKVSLDHFNQFKPGWQKACYQSSFSHVNEDWVMIMDVDEYLCLNKYTDIQSVIGSVGNDIGQIQFPWLNSISTSYFHKNTLDIIDSYKMHASDHVKSMIRCKKLTGIGVHSHVVNNMDTSLSSGEIIPRQDKHKVFIRDKIYYEHYPFILHFCSRGHFDVINRIVDQRFFNAKCGDLEKIRLKQFLTEEPSWSNLPNRYLLMKLMQTLPQVDINISMQPLRSNTDVPGLLRLFLRNIGTIVDFECHDFSTVEQTFEEKYMFKAKLAALDLSGICDLEEYLNSESQLEYVAKLRKSIQ